MKTFSSIIVPIIENGEVFNNNLFEIFKNKKIIIFGVPGAFTPTCSEQHLPGFLKLSDKIKSKGIDDIFCMSVNDQYVMQSWLLSYPEGFKVKGIADGNAEVSETLGVISDKSANFMGLRCKRFAMIFNNNFIINTFIDDTGKLKKTSAENILKNL